MEIMHKANFIGRVWSYLDGFGLVWTCFDEIFGHTLLCYLTIDMAVCLHARSTLLAVIVIVIPNNMIVGIKSRGSVPGGIYTDLFRSQSIADPYYRYIFAL